MFNTLHRKLKIKQHTGTPLKTEGGGTQTIMLNFNFVKHHGRPEHLLSAGKVSRNITFLEPGERQKEKLKIPKGAIGSGKSNEGDNTMTKRQKYKRTNNDLQNTTQKTKQID